MHVPDRPLIFRHTMSNTFQLKRAVHLQKQHAMDSEPSDCRGRPACNMCCTGTAAYISSQLGPCNTHHVVHWFRHALLLDNAMKHATRSAMPKLPPDNSNNAHIVTSMTLANAARCDRKGVENKYLCAGRNSASASATMQWCVCSSRSRAYVCHCC